MAETTIINTPGAAAGVDEPMIRSLVEAFYIRVRQDALLGPIFADAVHDWDSHLTKITDFWSSVLLSTGRYHGTPMRSHAALPDIAPPHFSRWLAIFRSTVEAECPARAAALFLDRAQRIAQSLELGIAMQAGRRGSPSTLRS